MNTPHPKLNPIRDPEYLKHLRGEPCVITGRRGTTTETVDPAHISSSGRGIKSPDNETLPLSHYHHMMAHSHGEISYFRKHLPDYVLRDALRAYARELYRKWKTA